MTPKPIFANLRKNSPFLAMGKSLFFGPIFSHFRLSARLTFYARPPDSQRRFDFGGFAGGSSINSTTSLACAKAKSLASTQNLELLALLAKLAVGIQQDMALTTELLGCAQLCQPCYESILGLHIHHSCLTDMQRLESSTPIRVP